jgi:carbamate kinase
MDKNILVALGGNAILKHTEKGTAEEQIKNIRGTARHLVKLIQKGYHLAITHGNGPQVGDILLKNELAKSSLPPMPLDICNAESQGMIGYMLQQCLTTELAIAAIPKPVVTIITQTVVDKEDSAFQEPSKPIGPFYTALEASQLRKEKGWTIINDSGRGFRRVVPSPIPHKIIEGPSIKYLYDQGVIVIASGGGGVPIIRKKDGQIDGIEGVIDKDHAAALLAKIIKAETLVILTDVPKAYLHYGKPDQTAINTIPVSEAIEYLDQGHFAPGSMQPKIEATIDFIEGGGKQAIITSVEKVGLSLKGKDGTIIHPD